MRRYRKTLLSVVIFLILAAVGNVCYSDSTPPHPFDISLEPAGEMEKNAPLTLNLTYGLTPKYYFCGDTGYVTVITLTYRKRDTLTVNTWPVQFDKDHSYSTAFQVTVQDNDTTELCILLGCGMIGYPIFRDIITTGDEVQFLANFDPKPSKNNSKSSDPNRDTLTQEQLQKEYEIAIDLRDESHFQYAEQLLGHIPDSCQIPHRMGTYIMKMTLDNVLKLHEFGIELDEVRKKSEEQPLKDSLKLEEQNGSLENQESSINNSFPGISLEYVDGETTPGILPTGEIITFYLRVNNPTEHIMDGPTNGFKVYSPDGADWQNFSADTLNLGWKDMFNKAFTVRLFGADGLGTDTATYLAYADTAGTGMPAHFDEVSFSITIGPFDSYSEGKTICLDSSKFGGHGWIWSYNLGNDVYFPLWDGPYWFTVSNSITYTGYLYYQDPVPPTTTQDSMRNVTIEMWDEDIAGDDLLASTTTDEFGYFELGPVENDDIYKGLDIFFRIYAENDACYVTEDYDGDIHMIQTPTVDDIVSGEYDTTIVADIGSSGPFFIANAILTASDTWYNWTSQYPPDIVQVVYTDDGVGSHYNSEDDYVYIEGIRDDPLYRPDTYDKSVMYHEYAHWLEHNLYFFDNSSGGPHEWNEIIGPAMAAMEGFATFFPNMLMNNPEWRNYNYNFSGMYWRNTENGETGVDGLTYYSANNYGAECEGSVASILWDIYDNIDDDYSTYLWPPLPPPNLYNPDGIGDALSDAPNNILDVLVNRTVSGHKPDRIYDFWLGWFKSPSHGSRPEMQDIWYEHGIDQYYICGDANGDGLVNAGDVVYLINHIFKHGPPPDPVIAGDANCDGIVNIGDAVYLKNFVYSGGPDPCACL
ncbi:MAG: dockerin type I domain-containing protein [Candidatus Zixiibacteriota bacterium]